MNSLRLKKMSYLKFKYFLSSDEDGTFWPGVVELPVEKELTTENISNDENKNQRIITGIILFVILSLFFLNKLSAFILFILLAFIAAKEWFDLFEYSIFIPYPLLLFSALSPLIVVYFYDLSDTLDASLAAFKCGVIDAYVTHASPGLREFTKDWTDGQTWFLDNVVMPHALLYQIQNAY